MTSALSAGAAIRLFLIALLCAPVLAQQKQTDDPFIAVLGIAQDAGYPQAACRKPCCERAWLDPSARRFVASLAIIDPATGERWIVDATPDLKEQLHLLDEIAPPRSDNERALHSQPLLAGVLLTHAHIGHYTGLQDLGREVTGARDVPVYAMPRMRAFLTDNAPWSQLVTLHNIDLRELDADTAIALNERITITPITVPHRDEFSETVAFRIEGPGRSVLYLPDIDRWTQWDEQGHRLEDELARVDAAYLDATFFSGDELGGRDMSQIPHPTARTTMDRLADLPERERAKVRFIHLNHTNPLLDPDSDAAQEVARRGFSVAEQGECFQLSQSTPNDPK